MELGAVIVYVEDVAGAVAFCQRAYDLEPGAVSSEDYAELRAGSSSLVAFAARSFVEGNLPGHGHAPAGFELVLVADDVQAAFDRAVAAGAEAVAAPAEKPWGQIVSYVSGPEGLLVELCSEWRG